MAKLTRKQPLSVPPNSGKLRREVTRALQVVPAAGHGPHRVPDKQGGRMSFFSQTVARILPYFPKPVVGYFSRHYIAGPSLEDAVRVTRTLMAENCSVTNDILGENIASLEEADNYARQYLDLLDTIHSEGLNANISVKPTQMGLLLDREHAFQNYRRIADRARKYDNFIRIDMEDSSITDAEFDLFHRLREYYPHVGIVIQSYLRRTLADAERLAAEQASVRLCKGIYKEPPAVAFQDRQEIRDNYVATLEILLKGGCRVGIATHDQWLVEKAYELLRELRIPREQYEFQMLLGVLPPLRRRIVAEGHPLRVYVPYGADWFPYSTRRLKENPDLMSHLIRDFFRSHK